MRAPSSAKHPNAMDIDRRSEAMNTHGRHHSFCVFERLRSAGLRPTRQRVALCNLMFGKGDRHLSAEELHAEAQLAGEPVSLATVYNTLHQFTDVGLVRPLPVRAAAGPDVGEAALAGAARGPSASATASR